MKKTIGKYEFVTMFDDYNRSENFTPYAREVLFDYYEDLEDGTGEEIAVDVIGICCVWGQYTYEECIREFSCCEDCEDLDACIDALSHETCALAVDSDSILVCSF